MLSDDAVHPRVGYKVARGGFMEVERQFAIVSAKLCTQDPSVEQGRMLQSAGLKTGGKFFAFAHRDDLFLKLPAERVRALIASGVGRPCELRKGSPMREWVRVTPADEESCADYVISARDFVAHQHLKNADQTR